MYATEIVTMPLPFGKEWVWFSEFNVVALAPHLDAAGRERALDELQAQWRQSLRPPVASTAA